MMTVTIVCVGKCKESYWRDACAEYAKRMTPYCRFQIVEVAEERVPDQPSQARIEKALQAEGKRILDQIPGGARVVALCIEGREMASEALAANMESAAVGGVSSMAFVIGGSWGLSKEIKQYSDLRLSMSLMTFPHQLARVMLCEQIYRAFQIMHDGKYHK